MPSAQPIFIVGPTAAGKSAVALELATRLDGEIISVDSMQVYRGLNIGTAKPSAAERARVAHHLIDVAELTESFDAAAFIRQAEAAVKEITGRGRRPIFCGGTGLYFKAFLEGLGEAPPGNPAVRAVLEALPLEELLRELKERDPVTFERIDRQNPRRVIRALEVIRVTGKAFSDQRAEWSVVEVSNEITSPPGKARPLDESGKPFTPIPSATDSGAIAGMFGFDAAVRALGAESVPSLEKKNRPAAAQAGGQRAPSYLMFGWQRAPGDLHRRIEMRVDAMFRDGLVAEVSALLQHGLENNRTAMQAIGYRQVVEHLRGERTLPATIELVKIRTRQFAKRQLTWFRRQLAVNWLAVGDGESSGAVAERVQKCLMSNSQ